MKCGGRGFVVVCSDFRSAWQLGELSTQYTGIVSANREDSTVTMAKLMKVDITINENDYEDAAKKLMTTLRPGWKPEDICFKVIVAFATVTWWPQVT